MDQQWTPCDNCHFSGENYRDKELLLWFMNDHDNSSHNDKNYDQQWTPGENYLIIMMIIFMTIRNDNHDSRNDTNFEN